MARARASRAPPDPFPGRLLCGRWAPTFTCCAMLVLATILTSREAQAVAIQSRGMSQYCYPHPLNNLCCLFCPPGTYVIHHCMVNVSRGMCQKCPHGEYALENGLEHCIQCTRCREADQVVVTHCTGKEDTKCQCKPGYYCDPNKACEICQPCGESCPDKEDEKQDLTKTTCNKPPGNSHYENLIVLVPVALLLAVIVVILYVLWRQGCRKKRSRHGEDKSCSSRSILCDKTSSAVPESGNPDPEEGTHDSRVDSEGQSLSPRVDSRPVPPNLRQPVKLEFDKYYAVIDNSETGWSKIIYIFQDHIDHQDWKEFVRKLGVGKHEIDIPEANYPGNVKEQKFQMLLTWRNKLGREASIFKLLDTAREMLPNTIHVQNIVNQLVNAGILDSVQDQED